MAVVRLVLTPMGMPDAALSHLPTLPQALPGTPSPAAMTELAAREVIATINDPAILQSTSGTTGGRPKITQMTHHHHAISATAPLWWETPESVAYLARPMLYNPELFYDALHRGGTCILSDSVQPERIEAEMATYGANALWTAPAVVHTLIAQRRPPPPGLALRVLRTSAAPLTPALADAAHARYGATMVQVLASSEAGCVAATPPHTPAGSVGRLVPWAEVRLVDEYGRDVPDGEVGQLLVAGPDLMTGYVGDPEATAVALRDGWLHTGDLARRDTEGFYYLAGRQTLQINVSGFKVSPEEVEEVLLRHPSVREVVVWGVMDAARGEVVRAAIVPEEPPPTVTALRAHCRTHLAGFKVPRQWEFREELPRSPLGKVLRHLL